MICSEMTRKSMMELGGEEEEEDGERVREYEIMDMMVMDEK